MMKSSDDIDCLKLLLEFGEDENILGAYGNNLLHLATKWNYPKRLEFLLHNAKIDPMAKNFNGKTPLDSAKDSNK